MTHCEKLCLKSEIRASQNWPKCRIWQFVCKVSSSQILVPWTLLCPFISWIHHGTQFDYLKTANYTNETLRLKSEKTRPKVGFLQFYPLPLHIRVWRVMSLILSINKYGQVLIARIHFYIQCDNIFSFCFFSGYMDIIIDRYLQIYSCVAKGKFLR